LDFGAISTSPLNKKTKDPYKRLKGNRNQDVIKYERTIAFIGKYAVSYNYHKLYNITELDVIYTCTIRILT